MANLGLFYSYKETRLDLDPTTRGSTVSIRLPPHGASTWPSKTARKRSHITEIPVAEDESSFRHRYLATAASIYHRTHHKSPRSFLWRILEDGKVLAIRVVDVSSQVNAADANLSLSLSFPSRIIPACVAFSDSKEHDVLSAFVLTETNHLYTLTLRPDYFRRPSSTEDNVVDWCKSSLSSGVSVKKAFRLVALSADELLLSTTDGGLLRLSRISGGDGTWNIWHSGFGT
jgi:nuclear pore complex protein Nup160